MVVFLDENRQGRVTLLWTADKEKGVIQNVLSAIRKAMAAEAKRLEAARP